MGRVHFLQLKFKQQTLSAREGFTSVNLLFNEHKFAQNVINDAEVGMRVVFIWFHYLSASVAHSGWLAELPVKRLTYSESRSYQTSASDTSPLLFFSTLFEEYFPQNVFLLVERVIVLDIVVVRLIEHTV